MEIHFDKKCVGLLFILGIFFAAILNSCVFFNCQSPAYDVDRRKTVESIGKEIATRYNVQFLCEGDSTRTPQTHFFCDFIDDRMVSLEQARVLFPRIMQDFYKKIVDTRVASTYWKCMHENMTIPELNVTAFGCKLSYWTKNFDRPQNPYIAQALCVNGKIYYYITDMHTQDLKLVYEESYEDGVAYAKSKRLQSKTLIE